MSAFSRTPFSIEVRWNRRVTAALAGSLSLPRRRGEGLGEGLLASALAAPPLIRPSATFSPPPRKGEGSLREARLAFQRPPFAFDFLAHSAFRIPHSAFQ